MKIFRIRSINYWFSWSIHSIGFNTLSTHSTLFIKTINKCFPRLISSNFSNLINVIRHTHCKSLHYFFNIKISHENTNNTTPIHETPRAATMSVEPLFTRSTIDNTDATIEIKPNTAMTVAT